MIDLRRIRVGIEIEGRLQVYEGLRVRATGTKNTNPLQNECQVTLNGLNARTRNFLLTETSPFNENRVPKRLIVEAGRMSTGLFTIYAGDIVSASVGAPPDVEMTLRAKTNNANNGKIVTFSGEPQMKLSAIAERVAVDNELRLDFQATDKNVANYSFSGPAARQVNRLADAGGVQAYVDDSTLFVKDRDTPIEGRVRVLNAESGMVGVPKATEKGVEVSYLIDGESDLGGRLSLTSKMNPSLDGDYVVDQLKFEMASHDDPFFYTALCSKVKT